MYLFAIYQRARSQKNSFKSCANDELTRVGRRILEKMHRSKKSAQEKRDQKDKRDKMDKETKSKELNSVVHIDQRSSQKIPKKSKLL